MTVSQPSEFRGDINLIQSELSKLSDVGIVTVTSENEEPDELLQCRWRIKLVSIGLDLM